MYFKINFFYLGEISVGKLIFINLIVGDDILLVDFE